MSESGRSAMLANAAMLIGRVIVVFGLIPNGLRKLGDFNQLAAGMGGTPQVIGGRPFPGLEPLIYFPFPEAFLAGSMLFDIAGSLLVIIGLRTRAAAGVLAGYCLLAMTIYHYDFSDAENLRSVMRSLPLVGGLILIAGSGAGAWSIDGWRDRRAHR